MKFRTLQDNLRKALLQRIGEGDLTGLRLAGQTGFKQAHISNFLNRKGEQNMYAVRKNDACTIKYVEVANRHLVLRPHNPAYPVEVLPIEEGTQPGDHLVGRVCHVGIET